MHLNDSLHLYYCPNWKKKKLQSLQQLRHWETLKIVGSNNLMETKSLFKGVFIR